MTSLARGLAVLRLFETHHTLTASQAAAGCGISRAAARRCLHTLERLGYAAAAEDGLWRLRPALLPLARAFLSDTLIEAAQPVLTELRDRLGESCSLAMLDGGEVVYVARAEAQRIVAVGLRVGSRLPAYCTSMGRVLLAALREEGLREVLSQAPFPARTARTITDAAGLSAAIARTRADGYAVVDEELEAGLRSIAVPVLDRGGRTAAALNLGAPVARLSVARMRSEILPVLLRAAETLHIQAG